MPERKRFFSIDVFPYLISPYFEYQNVVNVVKLGNSHESFVYAYDNGDSNVESTGPHLASLGSQRKQGLICFPLYGFHSEHSNARSPSAQLVSTPARDTPLEVEVR